MGDTQKIQQSLSGLSKSLDEASGAITAHIENLKAPFNEMINTFSDYSQETGKLTKGLVSWTKIMAIAIIVQSLAVIGQIVVAVILARTTPLT